jgi:hypothetical protein
MSHKPDCICVTCEDRVRAAAPDLLAALEACRPFLVIAALALRQGPRDNESIGTCDAACRQTCAAIAKAKGTAC